MKESQLSPDRFSVTVSLLVVHGRQLPNFFSKAKGSCKKVVTKGSFEILAGASSRDIRLSATAQIDGTEATAIEPTPLAPKIAARPGNPA